MNTWGVVFFRRGSHLFHSYNNMKSFFIFLFVACFSIQSVAINGNELQITPITDPKMQYIADTARWHPEEFHIVYPNMRLAFLFPYETEKSGVRNLLFQCRQTGVIRLLYTFRNNGDRIFTRFTARMYDAILLYNNGTFVRYEGVVLYKGTVFEDNNHTIVVDMREREIQPTDAESQQWLTLRSFYYADERERFFPATDRIRMGRSYDAMESDVKIRGYVFKSWGGGSPCTSSFVYTQGTDGMEFDDARRFSMIMLDGYFEIELDDISFSLIIDCLWHFPVKIYVTGNAGVFVITEEIPEGMPGAFQNITVGGSGCRLCNRNTE